MRTTGRSIRAALLGGCAVGTLLLAGCSLGGASDPVTVTVTPSANGQGRHGASSHAGTARATGPGVGDGTTEASTHLAPAAANGTSSSGASPSTPADSSRSGSDTVSGTAGSTASTSSTTSTTTSAGSTTTTSTSSKTTSSKPPKPVHVSTFEGDGKTYGVGMAVMALFSVAPTNPAAFEHAATVTVNGKPAKGAWFWQKPTVPGYALEALYREKDYWPAHSDIEVRLPVKGLSAGKGLAYDDNLSVDFQIGAAHISHVDTKKHSMVVTSDGKVVNTFPVSLGSAKTPTYDGVKVVMSKSNPVRMKNGKPGDPDYYNLLVPWSVRITNSGEFVHAASWNTGNIGSRNTSHGCTNLDVNDAKWFYHFSRQGDIVDYPHANPKGTVQPSWDGWGWWNVSWSQWKVGGALPR